MDKDPQYNICLLVPQKYSIMANTMFDIRYKQVRSVYKTSARVQVLRLVDKRFRSW